MAMKNVLLLNLIGGLSVLPSTILSFPTIVLIVKFSLVYFTIQTHSGLNDALDALETSQLFVDRMKINKITDRMVHKHHTKTTSWQLSSVCCVVLFPNW